VSAGYVREVVQVIRKVAQVTLHKLAWHKAASYRGMGHTEDQWNEVSPYIA